MIYKYTYICTYTVLSLGSELKDYMQHLSFWIWLTLINTTILSCIHFSTNAMILLSFWIHKISLCICTTFSLSFHVIGGTGCFCFLASVKSEEINTVVRAWCVDFESLVYVPRSGRAGLHEFLVSVLRNHHIDFHTGCTSSHFRYQWIRVTFSTVSDQPWLSLVFLVIAILTRVRWNLKVL